MLPRYFVRGVTFALDDFKSGMLTSLKMCLPLLRGFQQNPPVVSIDGHEDVPANDEDALLKAVANQPVSVAIDAGGMDLQFYSEVSFTCIFYPEGKRFHHPGLYIDLFWQGVFTGKCGTELNHGVAIVGYRTTLDGTKYWIVKNSWGSDWGEKGYIRMERGVSAKEGICGIAMEASYPIKNSSTNPDGTPSSTKDEL